MEPRMQAVTACVLLLLVQQTATQSLRVVAESVGPTWIAIRIEPPVRDDSSSEVVSYKVEYGSREEDPKKFDLERRSYEGEGTATTIEGLTPRTEYVFHIRPMYADGSVGLATWFAQTTADLQRPEPVTVTSNRLGEHPHSYSVTWNRPFYSGGAQIVRYRVKYAEVEVNSHEDSWEVVGMSDYQTLSIPGQEVGVTLRHLKADSYYQVTIQAVNRLGVSDEQVFVFKTSAGGERRDAEDTASGGTCNASTYFMIGVSIISYVVHTAG